MQGYVDIFRVAMRNIQNFNLLDEPGKTEKAVLLIRAISGSVDALLQ